MSIRRYTIGLDYGSLSCRGVLADTGDGRILAEVEFPYPHGVFYDGLPDGTRLPPLWALQHPEDYRAAFLEIIPRLIRDSNVLPEEIVGICLDTTASTVVAVDKNLEPICNLPEMSGEKHAYAKMWKHHAANSEADELTEDAKNIPALLRYGGRFGAEFMLPKVLETLHGAPEVFQKAETFFEYGDWLCSLLTGHEVRSGTYLTCKSLWTPEDGYPKGGAFDLITGKLAFHGGAEPYIAWPGEGIGTVCPEMAKRLGLSEKTVVSAPQMDGYAGLPGSGISRDGELAMVLGTSNSYLLLDRKTEFLPGICAAVPDNIVKGYTGYAAGQASAGDTLRWFIENCIPASYESAAKENGMGLHSYLTSLAGKKSPGESGLLALEWLNGNKSVLNDPSLSGAIVGLTLTTKPEDIYRALIEATAFGCRRILSMFAESGIGIDRIVASGGVALKNPMLMQIYSDILEKKIEVSPCRQAAALGSCIFAAVAAGVYGSVGDAVRAMAVQPSLVYSPREKESLIYDEMYRDYLCLHDNFGIADSALMHRLNLRKNAYLKKEQ